eukprot:5272410-Pleurochrysis_carterae.AAC.1
MQCSWPKHTQDRHESILGSFAASVCKNATHFRQITRIYGLVVSQGNGEARCFVLSSTFSCSLKVRSLSLVESATCQLLLSLAFAVVREFVWTCGIKNPESAEAT